MGFESQRYVARSSSLRVLARGLGVSWKRCQVAQLVRCVCNPSAFACVDPPSSYETTVWQVAGERPATTAFARRVGDLHTADAAIAPPEPNASRGGASALEQYVRD